MHFLRALALHAVFFLLLVAPCLGAPSARKIAQIDIGFVTSSDMMMAPDGRSITLLSLPGEKGSDCVLFDRRSHKITYVPGGSRMEPLCYSRDGRRLWVWGLRLAEDVPELGIRANGQDFIGLYDIRRKRYIRLFHPSSGEWDVPRDAVLSRNERTLVYATSGGTVYGIDTRSGRIRWRRIAAETNEEPITVRLVPNGSHWLQLKSTEGGIAQAQMVSSRTGRVVARLKVAVAAAGKFGSAFSDVELSPTARQTAIFQSSTQKWIFLNSRTGRVQWSMGGYSPISEGDLQWQWSPDGRFVGVSGPTGFQLRDAKTGKIIGSIPGPRDASVLFSEDGSRVYTLQDNDSGFGSFTAVWQWTLFPTRRQRKYDLRFMKRLRTREEQFALSPRHRNESLAQAARRGDPARVALLLDKGAYIEARDRNRNSPLMNALVANDVYGGPKQYEATARLLIARGANVSRQGGSLLAAAVGGSDSILDLLLRKGARVNGDASDYGTRTALHAAAALAELKSVRFLLAHGADPNLPDSAGKTPLMEAVSGVAAGSPMDDSVLPTIQVLIQHGARVDARAKNGNTALDMAFDDKIKALLRRLGAKS